MSGLASNSRTRLVEETSKRMRGGESHAAPPDEIKTI